eukprot:scaffold353_cov161-Skeletonema_marinoi.AAC.3
MQEISQIHSNSHCLRENEEDPFQNDMLKVQGNQQSTPPPPPPVPRSPSCLARYSKIDPSPKPQKNAAKKGFFSALRKKNAFNKKKVRFAPDEVELYDYDYSCDQDIYYQPDKIKAMNKQRFTDARKLRKQRSITVPSKEAAFDDIDMTKHDHSMNQLLEEAYDPERDVNEEVSIAGIEHFVYPILQLEMVRRKKQAQREVLSFKKAKRQALRLAELSEEKTQWAREVAIEKGKKYCVIQEVTKTKSKPSCDWRRSRRASV